MSPITAPLQAILGSVEFRPARCAHLLERSTRERPHIDALDFDRTPTSANICGLPGQPGNERL